MQRLLRTATVFTVMLGALPALADDSDKSPTLDLQTRSRVGKSDRQGKFQIIHKTVHWDPKKTAIIVCDMWQRHWCKGATARGAEMSPRMDGFLAEARRRGVLIVHAPSGGMKFYEDHPARKRATRAPGAPEVPDGIARGCSQIPAEKKGKWPIDQSDGGCDEPTKCHDPMDRHQTDLLTIRPQDAISDSGVECWNLFHQRGVENVMLVGVHTNMCVIGRPFGLRNMVRFGKNVVLVRDMTDTMYNSRKAPRVSHVRGTELVVEFIEKYVCPTITSSSLLGGPAFRFKQDDRPHVSMIVSDDHYHADKTLPVFAEELRGRHGCYVTVIHGEGTNRFPAMEELDTTDVAMLFIRRLAPPKEQLDKLRAYLDRGGPLIGIRTSSHAFDVRGKSKPGEDEWPEFDRDVQGGNYNGHGPNRLGSDIANVAEQAEHPLLSGIQPARWHSTCSLYYTAPLSEDSTLLMTGSIPDRTEPVTWFRTYKKARVFYTALGHPDDFKQPQFRRLLANAVFWCMDRPAPKGP